MADLERGYKITKDQVDLHGLPPEARGDYQGFIEKQITELLTRYGTIDLMWFDQFRNSYNIEKALPPERAMIIRVRLATALRIGGSGTTIV